MIPLPHLTTIFPNSLYRVSYGTETRGGGSKAALRPVRKIEDAFTKRLNALRKTFESAMEDLDELIQASHPLLFLFKSSEYASENEVRSIVHKGSYSTAEGVLLDDRSPKRAYIDGNPGLIPNDSIIFFGPKSDHRLAIETMAMASYIGLKIKVFVSNKPYR